MQSAADVDSDVWSAGAAWIGAKKGPSSFARSRCSVKSPISLSRPNRSPGTKPAMSREALFLRDMGAMKAIRLASPARSTRHHETGGSNSRGSRSRNAVAACMIPFLSNVVRSRRNDPPRFGFCWCARSATVHGKRRCAICSRRAQQVYRDRSAPRALMMSNWLPHDGMR